MSGDTSGPAVRLALVTVSPADAHDLARRLVEERIAACVNIVPGLRSVFRWEQDIREENETLLLLKVPSRGSETLPGRIAELHPYDVPEVLLFDVDAGLPTYLRWVVESCRVDTGVDG